MLIWLLLALFFRWRFQFSIRLLLVLAVAVALPFGWLSVEMRKANEQEEAVNYVMKAGCSVWYDCDDQKFEQFWMAPVCVPRTLPEWPLLIRLFGRDFFHYADQVDCPIFSDAELAQVMPQLSTLPALRTLSLNSFGSDNDVLSPLENLHGIRNVTVMDYGHDGLDDVGLKHIAAIKQLETLNIRNSHITDDGLNCLRGHPNLRCLFLYSEEVTRRSVPVFASLSKLEELYLYNSDLADGDLTDLRREKPHVKARSYQQPEAGSAKFKARFNKSAKSPPGK